MKKYLLLSVLLPVVFILGTAFTANNKKGGDVFEIYFNGKQVHQQFVHADKSVKALHLSSFNDNDKIEVFYSHCGLMGTNRVITVKNEKNELIKEFKFANARDKRSLMSFYRKDITAKNKDSKLNLYYSSKELPEGKLLASLSWKINRSIARL